MEPIEVVVLGAGASYVHGAPLTDEIVPLALTRTWNADDVRLEPLRTFLDQAFRFDPSVPLVAEHPGDDPHWSKCPGLVDLLSVVDMALERRENLVQAFDQDGLRRLRRSIELAIYKALEWSLSSGNQTGRRSTATKRLVRQLDPANSVIISFNYDVIADIALAKRADEHFAFERADVEVLGEHDQLDIDYGVRFANLRPLEEAPGPFFTLLKLHGSFNWVMSALTGNLYFGGMQKAVGAVLDYQDLGSADQRLAAERVGDMFNFYDQSMAADPSAEIKALEPVLVTPTHLKDLRNHHLSLVWRAAEEALRRARKVTFVGYSLPGDDLHVKYLFKHALETRYLDGLPEMVVVDFHNAEREPLGSTVEANYRRFFGDVEFHPGGFDAYVDQMGW